MVKLRQVQIAKLGKSTKGIRCLDEIDRTLISQRRNRDKNVLLLCERFCVHVATIIELFCKNEKINPGAYMFRDLLLTLRDYIDGNKHYTEVLQAAMPGYR